MSKTSLRETLLDDFSGRTFTAFAVFTCAPWNELEAWKTEFRELLEAGVIEKADRGNLAWRYRLANNRGS